MNVSPPTLASGFALLCVVFSLCPISAAETPPTPDQLAFFEKKIRPVLAQQCYKCHSAEAEKLKGNLLLDNREGTRMGGDTGHAVVPGDLRHSLLIQAIRWEDKDLQMPPKTKLPDEVIADFEKWVLMGAPDPRDGKAAKIAHKAPDVEKGREFWAFQAPKKSAPPKIKDTQWPAANIDRFILAGLEKKGLKPAGEADRSVLIRRVYFDLSGLPPSPDEIDAFVRDTSPNAYEKVVDRLLASQQFGECWGRHWLDVARYAESSGKENNILYPHAWRYRDYVIEAFTADKPYDQFLKEQLAGDLMPAKDDSEFARHLVATGFLALGPKSHNNRDRRQFQMDLVDEQIDALSQSMLGMTVACARCHDHKFDPIPTRDYYALAGIFLSTEPRYGTPPIQANRQSSRLISLPPEAEIPVPPAKTSSQIASMKRQLDDATKSRDELFAEARKGGQGFVANPRLARANDQVALLERQIANYDDNGNPRKLAMGVLDRPYGSDSRIYSRGELDKPGDSVPRGFLQVLSRGDEPKIKAGSGRLELAEWIASPSNPLTARVMVNRVWHQLFGRGLVSSVDNFGTTGQPPSNPELLDYLAVSFMENGWSIKKIVREIALSRAYRMNSDHNAQNYAADPDNILVWRMTKRRLDAEAIRDAILSVSGRLDKSPVLGSPVEGNEGNAAFMLRFGTLNPQAERNCRSVYLSVVREQIPDALAVFDFAEPSLVIGDREDTTVPAQALFLMNSQFVTRQAESLADRVLAKATDGIERIRLAYQMVFARPPTPSELQAARAFFDRFLQIETRLGAGRNAYTAFCQALFATAEFRYLN